MSRRRPTPLPEPPKRLNEMTAGERAAFYRQTLRVIRDDEVRRGIRRPHSMREIEIAREGRAEREERRTRRAARAERRRGRAAAPPGPADEP